jgi:hypothetical protein
LSDNIRIQETFQAMNDVERERFETWRQSNIDEKKMKKILSNIPGTGKIQPSVSAVLRAITKIYVGQLVEEAKLI